MEEYQNKKRNPFNVMIDPRGFIRDALSRKKTSGWFLAFMTGLVWLFGKAYAYDLGLKYTLSWIVGMAILFAIPVGYGLIHIVSAFLYWTGKIFNGKASYYAVYKSYLSTRILEIFFIASWLGLIGIFGAKAFTPFMTGASFIPAAIMALVGIQLVFAFWQWVVLLHTLGEVQKLSAWVTIWNVLLTWIIMLVLDASLNGLVTKISAFKSLAIWGLLHF